MANESICVFCGEKPGMFRSENILVGNTSQLCCKTCAKEVAGLSEVELCQKALRLGHAQNPERLQARIELITQAEAARPKCLRCNTPMKFNSVVHLDASPLRDTLFSETFDLLPCLCPNCGRFEFFTPAVLGDNPTIAYLHRKDVTG